MCLLSSVRLCFWGPNLRQLYPQCHHLHLCPGTGPQPDTNTESPGHRLSDPVPSGDRGPRKHHRLSKAVAGSSPLLLWRSCPEEGERAAQTVTWRPAAMGGRGRRDRAHLLEREHPRLRTHDWPKEPGEGATRFKGDRLCLPGLTRDVDGREEDRGGWHAQPPAPQGQLTPLQTGAALHS